MIGPENKWKAAARLAPLAVLLCACGDRAPDRTAELPEHWDPFLDTLQARTFQWFWDETDPATGLTAARAPSRPYRARRRWVATDYLSTNQGPIVTMIENYRSEMIWERMKRSPCIATGLCRAGFRGGWLGGGVSERA